MALKLTLLFAFIAVLKIGVIDAFRTDYTQLKKTYSYYKFHKTPKTWADAKLICQSEDNSILFHPEDEAELEYVLSKLGVGNNDGDDLITGLSDKETNGVYKTVEGYPLSQVYNKWGQGEPDTQHSENHCVRLNTKSHTLEVDSCEEARRFICKHEKETSSIFQDILFKMHHGLAELKSTIAYSSHKLDATVQRIESNQTTAMGEELVNQQLAKQTAALESLTDTMQQTADIQFTATQNQTETMQVLAANQKATLELLIADQTAALNRLTDALQEQAANQITAQKQAEVKQLVTLGQLVSKQTATLDRQTATLEQQALTLNKLADAFPTYIHALQVLTAQIKDSVRQRY